MKPLALLTAILALTLGLAIPASADHVHSAQLGNGRCVLLAQNGGEGNVQLPGYETNPANRRHPLHVKVHLGRPGQVQAIGVYDTPSDPCYGQGPGAYVNLKG